MPLYEYRCKACGHQFEKIQSFSAPEEKVCPVCGGEVEKLLSAPAVQFKGSGWYVTDYARGGAAVEAVWIAAQHCGLSVQPFSPVFLYARDAKDLIELSASFAEELGDLQHEFRKVVGIPADAAPVLVLRFAASEPASVRSRRSLQRVRLLER